jgi:hypothetical protein
MLLLLLFLVAGKTPEEIRKTFNIKVGTRLAAAAAAAIALVSACGGSVYAV